MDTKRKRTMTNVEKNMRGNPMWKKQQTQNKSTAADALLSLTGTEEAPTCYRVINNQRVWDLRLEMGEAGSFVQ